MYCRIQRKRNQGGITITKTAVSKEDIDRTYQRLDKYAESGGYHLNPDTEFTKELVKSLLVNQERYGYWACPCRLATGDKQEDLDIICPCDYRDADLNEYNTCYCALYVSKAAKEGKAPIESIPERRSENKKDRPQFQTHTATMNGGIKVNIPVWRCRVCGYLCARDEPPELCPICKAKKERFEEFLKPSL